jgi:hypothetical protein
LFSFFCCELCVFFDICKLIKRLMGFYMKLKMLHDQCSPRISYAGIEAKSVKREEYLYWPREEEMKPLGPGAVQIWHKKIPAMRDAPPIEGYCFVEVCLDEAGSDIPKVLTLYPEMEGHELCITIYVNMYGRIQMKAIGGFTSHKTRADLHCLNK